MKPLLRSFEVAPPAERSFAKSKMWQEYTFLTEPSTLHTSQRRDSSIGMPLSTSLGGTYVEAFGLVVFDQGR